MLYIKLDDREIPRDEYDSLDASNVTIQTRTVTESSSTNNDIGDYEIVYNYAGDLVFYGDSYTELYNKLLNFGPEINRVPQVRVKIDIYEDCCPDANGEDLLIFTGWITSESIDWCDSTCSLSCQAEDGSADVEYNKCLKRTYIWTKEGTVVNDGGTAKNFQELTHPYFRYCSSLRPAFVHDVLLGLTLYVVALGGVVAILAFFISLVYNAVALILSILSLGAIRVFASPIAFIEGVQNLPKIVSGCEYGHPAPTIRSYLQNVCDACNLKLESSTFNDPNSPYYNAVYFSAPVLPGSYEYINWIDDNKPLFTGEVFLKRLGMVFNHEYRVKNGSLIFERRDFFIDREILFDASEGEQSPNVVGLCYKFNQKAYPSAAEFKFELDTIDYAARKSRKFYEDIVDWNYPVTSYPTYKGLRTYRFPIGTARFRNDGLSRDVLTFWEPIYTAVSVLAAINPINFVVQAIFGTLGNPFDSRFDDALILPSGICSEDKILIWDGVDPLNAKVRITNYPLSTEQLNLIRDQITRLGINSYAEDWQSGFTNRFFNRDMWVSAEVPAALYESSDKLKPYVAGNLYDRFWYIDDPRISTQRGFKYTLNIVKSCDFLRNLDFSKSILLPVGYGTIDTVQIDQDTITITGTV